MDTEHRHELKQNDFIECAKKAPDYIKAHWWETACVVVIIGALVMHFSGSSDVRPNMDKQAAVTSVYQDISAAKGKAISGEGSIADIEELVTDLLAKSVGISEVQGALVKVKAADAIRAQLHYSDGMPTAEMIESHTVEAIALYEQAIESAKGNSNVEALAKFGIALATQDAGKFDEAATFYGQIIANTDYSATCIVELAKEKLDGIATARQTYTFAEPATKPVVEITEEVKPAENAVN